MSVVDLEAELGMVELGDRRRSVRAVAIGRELADDPSRSFPSMFDSAGLEAWYRFSNSEAVSPGRLLAPHFSGAWARAGERQCLIVHDTTEVSFPGESEREGLHFTGTRNLLHLHVSLAVELTEAPVVHGFVGANAYVLRGGLWGEVKESGELEALGSGSERWENAARQVNSAAPSSSSLVHVMDREADDYTLWVAIMGMGDDFVIRSARNRRTTEPAVYLFDRLVGAPILLQREVILSRRSPQRPPSDRKYHPSRESRPAVLSARAGTVEILRSKRLPAGSAPPSMTVNVVEVVEQNPPEGVDPVAWRLITSLPVATPADVATVIDIYRKRWLVEEFFKALKTGCSLEERQAESRRALLNTIAVLAPAAIRLLQVRALGRNAATRDEPAQLSEDERGALMAMPRAKLPRNPSNRDVMLAMARLGGLLKPKHEPGWLVLGRGYAVFAQFLEGWMAAKSAPSLRRSRPRRQL